MERLSYCKVGREIFNLEVVTCFRSMKGGGNLSIDLSIGNPMV